MYGHVPSIQADTYAIPHIAHQHRRGHTHINTDSPRFWADTCHELMHQRRVAAHTQAFVHRYIFVICIIYWDKSFLHAGLPGCLAFVYPASLVMVGAALCMVLHELADIVTRAWPRVTLWCELPQGDLQSPAPPCAGTSGTTVSDGKCGTAALMHHCCGCLTSHGLHRAFRCLRGVLKGLNDLVSEMKMPRACIWTSPVSCSEWTCQHLVGQAGQRACPGVTVCHACTRPHCGKGEGTWGTPHQGSFLFSRRGWAHISH